MSVTRSLGDHSVKSDLSIETRGDLDAIALWFVVLAYGAGDTLSTILAISSGGYESHAVARWFLHSFGIVGLLVHKTLILVAILAVIVVSFRVFSEVRRCLGVPDWVSTPLRYVVPAGVVLRGIYLTIHNLSVAVALW